MIFKEITKQDVTAANFEFVLKAISDARERPLAAWAKTLGIDVHSRHRNQDVISIEKMEEFRTALLTSCLKRKREVIMNESKPLKKSKSSGTGHGLKKKKTAEE